MTRAPLRTSFKVKRSQVRVTGRLTQTHKMCHIFRTVRPENFKVGVRMKDVDARQQQAPRPPRLTVKVTRSHGMSDPCGPYYEICNWYSDKVARCVWPTVVDSRWHPRAKIKVISLHRLYVSSLPLLNSGNKMLHICHYRRAGAYRVGRTR